MHLLILQSYIVQSLIKAVKLQARSQGPKWAALSDWDTETDRFKQSGTGGKSVQWRYVTQHSVSR
jgi:hypothetical protein